MAFWPTDDLHTLEEQLWESLHIGVADEGSPFHTPILATADKSICRVRTVVLRSVVPEGRLLSCHTDIRSPKIAQIRENPVVGWLFYDAGQQVQIRVEGRAVVYHGDEPARAAWERSRLSSRIVYLSRLAPGTIVDEPLSGVPKPFIERVPTAAESEAGWQNFALIATTVSRFDWLHLAASRHRRAELIWEGSEFSKRWLIP